MGIEKKLDTIYTPYEPSSTYDLAVVIPGDITPFINPMTGLTNVQMDEIARNPNYFANSKALLELTHGKKLNRIGGMFITGGDDLLALNLHGLSQGEKTLEYLMKRGVSPRMIFKDFRAMEMVGNFAFPAADPLPENPALDYDLKRGLLIVAPERLMPYVLPIAERVLPTHPDVVHYLATPNPREVEVIDFFWQTRLVKYIEALKHVPFFKEQGQPDPQKALNFLLTEHPAYKDMKHNMTPWFRLAQDQREEALLSFYKNISSQANRA
jgi:hypothetical protein